MIVLQGTSLLKAYTRYDSFHCENTDNRCVYVRFYVAAARLGYQLWRLRASKVLIDRRTQRHGEQSAEMTVDDLIPFEPDWTAEEAERAAKELESLDDLIQEREKKLTIDISNNENALLPGQTNEGSGVLTQSVAHDLPGEPEHFDAGEIDFKEVVAEPEVVDSLLMPYLDAAQDEVDQPLEGEEEVVFKTAIVGGPPKKIKLTANKIAGVEFHLDGTGLVDILGDESIDLKDPNTKAQMVDSQVRPGGPATMTLRRYQLPDKSDATRKMPTGSSKEAAGPPPRKPPPKARPTSLDAFLKPESPSIMQATSKGAAMA